MKSRRSRALRPAVAAMAAALLVAGCTSGGATSSESSEEQSKSSTYREGMVGDDAGGEPVDGGTLSMSAFSEPRSLDPAVTIAAGSTGGIEMANIYDTLMRYDSEAQDFVPQLAESLEPNDDFTEWTLKLRDGVKFSNGDSLDSAAVKASQERYASMPAPEAALWAGNVTKVETPDDATVVYSLKGPWPLFPSILSSGPGMIVHKDSAGKDGKFDPIGAGPFTLEKWAPQEEMVLAANQEYWNGRPHLDQVRVVYIADPQAGVDSLKAGDLDAAFLRDPDKVDAVLGDGYAGYVNMVAASNMALINASEGRPGEDPRVRKAMQLATSPQLMMERSYNGAGDGSSTMFPDYSRWHTETEGLPYDAAEAKKLLEQAKADGFDGKVEYLDSSDPASRATALAFKASLESVGFDVEPKLLRTVTDVITKVAVERDYDVAGWGLSFREADPFSKMAATLRSSGTQTFGMYTSKEMDALIDQFQAASEEQEQLATMDKIQKRVNEDVPFLNWGTIPETTAWNDNVHDVTGAAVSMILFDKAWKG